MTLTNIATGTLIAIVAAAALVAGLLVEAPSLDSSSGRDSGQSSVSNR